MRALMINLPFIDYTQPPLGIPKIVAYVKKYSNHQISQYDLNIELFDNLLSKKTLQYTVDYFKNSKLDQRKKCISNSKVYENLPQKIEDAKKILTDNKMFYEYPMYILAMETVKLSLNLLNQGLHHFSLSVTDFHVKFDVEFDSSISNLNHCLKIFDDGEFNPIKLIIDEELDKVIANYKPEVIGLSNIFYSQDFFAIYVTKYIKEKYPQIRVVLGGPAILGKFRRLNGSDEEVYHNYFWGADFFIINDGEKSFLSLLDLLESQNLSGLSKIDNLVYFNGKTFIQNATNYIENLNELPPPDFDRSSLNKYLVPELVLPYDATRGCYWGQCAFCDYGFSSQKKATAKYREVSPNKLISDLKSLKQHYRVDKFCFTCDAIRPKTAELYANAIKDEHLNIKWMVDTRLEKGLLKENRIRNLREGGLVYASFGMESYSQKVLNHMNKGISNVFFKDIIKQLHFNDITVDIGLFKFFPTETILDYKETLEFLFQNQNYIHRVLRMGKFSLLCDCKVSQYPEKYGIKINNEKKHDGIFKPYLLSYKDLNSNTSLNIPQEIKELEEKLFDEVYMGEHPWVNGNQNAHSLLFTVTLGKESLKKINKFYGKILFIAANYV